MRRTSKAPRALHLKRETVRQLGALELARAGGAAPIAIERDTEAAACPWTHIAAATVACG